MASLTLKRTDKQKISKRSRVKTKSSSNKETKRHTKKFRKGKMACVCVGSGYVSASDDEDYYQSELQSILDGSIVKMPPYFVEFLTRSHCSEYIEFYYDLCHVINPEFEVSDPDYRTDELDIVERPKFYLQKIHEQWEDPEKMYIPLPARNALFDHTDRKQMSDQDIQNIAYLKEEVASMLRTMYTSCPKK